MYLILKLFLAINCLYGLNCSMKRSVGPKTRNFDANKLDKNIVVCDKSTIKELEGLAACRFNHWYPITNDDVRDCCYLMDTDCLTRTLVSDKCTLETDLRTFEKWAQNNLTKMSEYCVEPKPTQRHCQSLPHYKENLVECPEYKYRSCYSSINKPIEILTTTQTTVSTSTESMTTSETIGETIGTTTGYTTEKSVEKGITLLAIILIMFSMILLVLISIIGFSICYYSYGGFGHSKYKNRSTI